MVGILAFTIQFSFQSKSCKQHAAVMVNGLQQCESVIAMNGIKFPSPHQEQGGIKSPDVLNVDLEIAVISKRCMDFRGSEPVECHVVCRHADNDHVPRVEKYSFLVTGLAPSFAIMMWISTWHGNNMM